MSGPPVLALILQLESHYGAAPPASDAASAPEDQGSESSLLRRPRRRRRSGLDAYRHIAESFIRRRAQSAHRSHYTYARLAQLIERHSGRRFVVSTLQRRMVVWGLIDGMERYQK
jgi:hypothetical protein